MKKQIFILFLTVILAATACNLPVTAVQPSAHTTPAPTQVAGEPNTLSTSTPEDIGNVPDQGGATGEKRKMPDGVVNIMILGSDFRPNAGHRTDVMMLVSVNTVKQTVSVVSFPRDLYVPIPGWTKQRLNTAEPHGGFDLLADTLDQNFGVRPTYYVMTDFGGFKGIIDSVGGVDVNAKYRLTDSCDLPTAENGQCTVHSGINHMDGETALWYVRSRHTTNDLYRNERQQEVILALFTKLMSAGAINHLPDLYNQYKDTVKTNLTVEAMLPLLPTAAKVFSDHSAMRSYVFSVEEAVPYTTDTGAMVNLPDYGKIAKILDEAIFNP